MTRLVRFLKAFRRDASGATAIEYALVATFISVAIVASVQAVGDGLIASFYEDIAGAFGT